MKKENKKLRIAFVNDTFLEGRGADTVIYELARRIGKEHDVYVIAGETNIKEGNFKFIKINLPKLFQGNLSDFDYFGKLDKLYKQISDLQAKYHFDIFNVHHIGLSPTMNKFNTVYTWHGSPPTNNIFRKAISIYFKHNIKYQNKIFISEYMASLFKSGTAGIIINNGLSKEFRPKSKNDDKEFMLYVGRLEKHKNVSDLIKVASSIDMPLVVVGYGPEEEKLKLQAGDMDYERYYLHKNYCVSFLGKISRKELLSLYQDCSFFVSSSKWEGFGLIFVEAAACGKPSIAYNTSAMPEVILNNETGYLSNNLHDFTCNALKLKNNKGLRDKMGKNALEFSKKFDWDKTSKKYVEVFRSLK